MSYYCAVDCNATMGEKYLQLTFRKIIAKDVNLQGKKVGLVLWASANTFKLQCLRLIKNSIANFYGQSVALPHQTEEFYISVQKQTTDQKYQSITQFLVKKEQISEFTYHKNTFHSQSNQLKLTWQAQIFDQERQSMMQYSQRSQEDFEQSKEKKISKNKSRRRYAYSPEIGKISKRREKRPSFRLKKEATTSEPLSQLPYQFTLDTNDTKNIVLKKKSTEECIKKDHSKDIDSQSFDKQVHSIFKPKDAKNHKSQSKANRKKKLINHLETPRLKKKNPHENSKKSLLQRISVKSLVYTGVIGVISGLTATQL